MKTIRIIGQILFAAGVSLIACEVLILAFKISSNMGWMMLGCLIALVGIALVLKVGD